ncbi:MULTISPECIES: PP2C family protein-serine/threonine phosphatase [unclassified Streptomyces]|uniref:PP2C family protein-serine/threonine phosphatase n=1 Tax=unclassified Streptomyces TaxID=2593676 RepID=UPI00017F1063|nr:protein phosphatase 2C domain-containing protein [Streptomyces sp. SPB074]EDY43964.1 mucin-2 [Streptomyces sp. SPB074]
MRTYATAQHIGLRGNQCDATAFRTDPVSGARAYVVLDGIGDRPHIRDWVRIAAARLARAAARRLNAEAGLRAVYKAYAADPLRQDSHTRRYEPSAAAIVAVHLPGKPLTIAWAGDCRAYAIQQGTARRLTQDHNLRRVYPPCSAHNGGNRNIITSYLGDSSDDDSVRSAYGHPAIETATVPGPSGLRLLLASDGAYEPHEDSGHALPDFLTGTPGEAARRFVNTAVETSLKTSEDDGRQYADNATVLVADL